MSEGRYLPGLTPSGAVRAIASSLSAVGVLWHSQIFQLSEYLSSVVVASADFGGVVGPVAGGGALPCGGDADRAALRWGAEHEPHLPVIAFTEVHNHASRAVMERLRMRPAGLIRRTGLIEGKVGLHPDAPFALYRI